MVDSAPEVASIQAIGADCRLTHYNVLVGEVKASRSVTYKVKDMYIGFGFADSVTLAIEPSATTAELGFPLKVVTRQGRFFCLATDETHANQIIQGFKRDLRNRIAPMMW